MASSVFNLGEVISAFDRPRKPNVYSYLDPAYDTIRNLNSTLDSNRTASQGDFNDYLSAFKGATPQSNKLNQSSIDYISGLVQRPIDAVGNFNNLLGSQFNLIGGLKDQFAQVGLRAENDRLAGLGLSPGTGGGSFGSLQTTNRIGQNSLPLYLAALNTTGQNAQSLSDQNYRDTLLNLGLLGQRQAMVDAPANRLLAPTSVRNQMLGADTNSINAIVNAMKNNVLGMSENLSGLGRFGKATSAIDQSLNSALDTGLSLYSGGMLGGAPSDRMDAQAGAGAYRGMGGGGGQGGGINIQQLMAMLGGTGRGNSGGGGGYYPYLGTGEEMPFRESSFAYP